MLQQVEPAGLRGRTGRCRPIGRRQTGAGRGKGGRAERPWPNHANWPRYRCGLAALALPPGRAALRSDRIWQKTQMSRAWKAALRRLARVFLLQWKRPAACGRAGFWIGCPRWTGARRPMALLRPAAGRRGLRQNSGKLLLSAMAGFVWVWLVCSWARGPAWVWMQPDVGGFGRAEACRCRPRDAKWAGGKLPAQGWRSWKTMRAAGLRDGHLRGASFENWLVWMSK